MDAPIFAAPPSLRLPPAPPFPAGGTELPDLLRQVIELQKEQIGLLKTQMAAQDQLARWRSFLARWTDEFPDVGPGCKQSLPIIERAFLSLLRELTEKARDSENGLEDEFGLGEFLDRYGMRLGQLGAILSQIGPLADATPAE